MSEMNASIRDRVLFEPTYFSTNAISQQPTIPKGPFFGTGEKLGSRRTGNGAFDCIAEKRYRGEYKEFVNYNKDAFSPTR